MKKARKVGAEFYKEKGLVPILIHVKKSVRLALKVKAASSKDIETNSLDKYCAQILSSHVQSSRR